MRNEAAVEASGSAYNLPLDCGDAPLELVGGKARNLAKLTAAGFDVPSGFVLTTEAYRRFVESNGLEEGIRDLLGGGGLDDPATLEEVSAEIRARFEAGEVPPDLAASILRGYRELGSVTGVNVGLPVAVRSSATAEDLPEFSFAGQQDTYLNVIGAEALESSVRRCWASLWTARAIGYRARNDIDTSMIGLAVIVQELIPSDSSGVLFTANPLTGNREELVIDASFGLGEAIVSGQVEPDHYVVTSGTWEIQSRTLGSKAVAIVPRHGGHTETLTRSAADRPAMTDEQIVTLAKTACRIAEYFGAPQDVEWAWRKHRLHILQSRPVTSLYPLPEGLDSESGTLRAYSNFSAIQGVIDPITPLGREAMRQLGKGFVPNAPWEMVVEAGGRVFLDLTPPLYNPQLRKIVLGTLGRVDATGGHVVEQLIREGRFVRTGAPRPSPTPPPRKRGRLATRLNLIKTLFPARHLVRRAVFGMLAPGWAQRRAVGAAGSFISQVREDAARAESLEEVIASFERDLRLMPSRMYGQLVPLIGPIMLLMSVVDQWLEQWIGAKPGTGQQLMRGLQGNVTIEMDVELWELARTVRRSPETHALLIERSAAELAQDFLEGRLPTDIQGGLEAFLGGYGMRGMAEIDMGRRRWREDPTLILDLLQGYLRLEGDEASPTALLEAGAKQAEALRRDCVRRVRKGNGPRGLVRSLVLDRVISRLRKLGGLRELPKLHFCTVLDIYRRRFSEWGVRLADSDVLNAADDIFFTPLEVLKSVARGEAIDARGVVARERAKYDREMRRRRLPRLLLSTGEAFYEKLLESEADGLAGVPVSPGVVEGSARVVLTPQGAQLEKGEILVCPSTDPCWTPLFVTAGGLVMEMGGLTTHGAVVAREYGIPAVVGVHEATDKIQTGDRLRVDGSTGQVVRLDT